MAHYLICYDIANPKRLGKVHRRAVSHAVFVQYSVYYLRGSQAQLRTMLEDIEAVIDVAQDDVRAYTVSPLAESIQLGISWLPGDLALV
ncbi:MAG: CRISPR-associated endonuclease Cas2 [Exilibacterium sp.]